MHDSISRSVSLGSGTHGATVGSNVSAKQPIHILVNSDLGMNMLVVDRTSGELWLYNDDLKSTIMRWKADYNA